MAIPKMIILSLGLISIIGAAQSLMCYDCYNENDNDECNGVTPGSNSSGVLVECPASLSNPTCHSAFKMNANGDGWVIRKQCMEYDECYDRFYSASLLVEGEACFENEPVANTACDMCCMTVEDGCNNDFKYSWYVMPATNNWDSAVDTGFPPTTQAPTAAPGGGDDSGAAQHTAFVISLLFTIIPCII